MVLLNWGLPLSKLPSNLSFTGSSTWMSGLLLTTKAELSLKSVSFISVSSLKFYFPRQYSLVIAGSKSNFERPPSLSDTNFLDFKLIVSVKLLKLL